METLTSKIAYIKGLAEGLNISDETAEGETRLVVTLKLKFQESV